MTETPHPQTTKLSVLAQRDLLKAYQLLAGLDQLALEQVLQQAGKIKHLQEACFRTMAQGGRVILVGCGASGRIAAQIEHDWRFIQPNPDALTSVLAGGEVTLIESVEACEDQPGAAVSQLEAVELCRQDLLIALSAGGESPFILGALDYAKSMTHEAPWFLYCNPDAILLQRNPQHPVGQSGFALLNLAVGPMALTGSTRMQATTAMTFSLMLALFPKEFNGVRWSAFYRQLDWSVFLPLTEWEEQCYRRQEAVVYRVPDVLAMPVLADMTERSPTFNLPAFANQQDAEPFLLNYVLLSDVRHGSEAAWQALLLRTPRSTAARLQGFDLSQDAQAFLTKIKAQIAWLDIRLQQSHLEFSFGEQRLFLDLSGFSVLEIEFLLRLILVNHSTLMMGRLGYYHGNLMTNLKPSNAKLIDRTIRYVLFLHEQETGQALVYADVAQRLANLLPSLKAQESIVFRLLSEFKSSR